jgi:hypothetical protein
MGVLDLQRVSMCLGNIVRGALQDEIKVYRTLAAIVGLRTPNGQVNSQTSTLSTRKDKRPSEGWVDLNFART